MLDVLNIKSHNEARKGYDEIRREQGEILKLIKEIKVSFAEFEKKKESRISLQKNRVDEREKKYLEWKNLGLGDKSSPGKVAQLKDFLEQKQRKLEESLAEEARQGHLDEITGRLWEAQTPDPPPRIKVSRTESSASNVSSSARRERASSHLITPPDDPRARDSSGAHRPHLSRESTSRGTHSHSSSSSKSSHHRRRDSSIGSNSTTTSLRERFLAGIDRGFQGASSTSPRRVSASSSNVQSGVGTPRPRADPDLDSEISRLSLAEVEEPPWSTVATRARTRHAPPAPIISNAQQRSPNNQLPTAQLSNLSLRRKQEASILCVNWDNIGKSYDQQFLLTTNSTSLAFSKLAQTYFELLRLWSINNKSPWPFDRVESVGVRTNPVTDIDSRLAMDLLASPDFESGDFPNEKDRLLSRIGVTRPVAFNREHLKQFDYVICFDERAYDAMKKARSGQQTAPSNQCIVMRLGLDHLAGWKLKNSEAEEAAQKIKSMVESFMKEMLGWKAPDRKLAGGQRRTLQVTVNNQITPHIIGKSGAKITALRKDTNCSIRVFDEGIGADKSLILATGRVEDLRQVERKIEAELSLRKYGR